MIDYWRSLVLYWCCSSYFLQCILILESYEVFRMDQVWDHYCAIIYDWSKSNQNIFKSKYCLNISFKNLINRETMRHGLRTVSNRSVWNVFFLSGLVWFKYFKKCTWNYDLPLHFDVEYWKHCFADNYGHVSNQRIEYM